MDIDCFHLGVKAVIVNPEEKVLLLRRRNYWDLPGGRLHKGETEVEALRREVEEETGLSTIEQPHPLMMFLSNIRIPSPKGDVGLIFSVYRINLTKTFDPVLSEEHDDFAWCSLQNVAEKLKDQYQSDLIGKLLKSDIETNT